MEIDPLIEELARDSTSGTKELVEAGAKMLVAFSGGWRADSRDEFLEALVIIGRKLVAAKPATAPYFHLITELYARASEPVDLVMVRRALRTAAVEFTQTLQARTEKIALQGAALLSGAGRVLTLGRTQVVEQALLHAVRNGCLAALVIGEGRPGYDGRDLAETMAAAGGINITVVSDGAVGSLMDQVDLVMVGAEAIVADGVVARIGASVIASFAKSLGKPAYALGGVMTLLPPSTALPDPCVPGDPGEIWDAPPEGVSVANPIVEVVPAKLFKGIVMEAGPISPFEAEQRVKTMPVPPWLE